MIKEVNHAEIRGKEFQQSKDQPPTPCPSEKVIMVGKQKEGQSSWSVVGGVR